MDSFKWRMLLAALLFLSGGAAGWFLKPEPPAAAVEASASTSIATSVATSVATSRVVENVVRTRKPDGTIVEQKQTITDSVKEKSKTIETSSSKSAVAVAPVKRSRYRLGADYLPSISKKPDYNDVELRAGARLGDSPAWIEGGYDFKHKQAKIGIAVEF